jgi:hypothetical protein
MAGNLLFSIQSKQLICQTITDVNFLHIQYVIFSMANDDPDFWAKDFLPLQHVDRPSPVTTNQLITFLDCST